MKRYLVTWMCCLVNCLLYSMRLNLNIAIIEMVRRQNTTEIQQSNETVTKLTTNNTEGQRDNTIPTFDWDEITQQTILGAFYYGYAVTPIPGGWLAGKIGGKRVIGFAVIWTSLLTALIPWAAGVSVGLLVILRILDGLGQGTVNSASYVILGKWTVRNERSLMISISDSGMTLGMIVSSYVSGWICSAYEFGGWPMSFYTYSMLGVVWAIIWAAMIYETPHVDPCISKGELEFFNSFVIPDEQTTENTSVPWWDIFTSSAVWAITIGCIALDFGFFVIVTEMPNFISTILDVDVKTTGRLISIPSIVRYLIMLLAAICADYIIRRECLSVLNTRKLFVILEFAVPAACFVAFGYVGHNTVTFMVLFTTAFGALGFHAASTLPNPMDISKKYSGIIVGVVMTLANCTGFIGPIITGILTEDNNTLEQWSWLFMLTAGIQIFGMVFFLIFAKGEEQEWSTNDTIHSEEMRNLIN